MVFINEWLPNPTGIDTKAEFVELFNNGNAAVSLAGWKLRTSSGKKNFSLDGYRISAQGYLVLTRSETKLTLKNSDEAVFLYNAAGQLVDSSAFPGAAPEGQSYSRINYTTDPSEHFTFSEPTPGAANAITLQNGISANAYPFGIPLNTPLIGAWEVFGITIGVGAIITALMLYFLKRDEKIAKLFFGRDEEIWP